MAANQSIEGQRMESIETMVIVMVLSLAFIVFCYFYYEHPWYYFNKYYFMGLDFIPDVVNKYLFLWQPNAETIIPLMSSDLIFHANDYSAYYIESDVGANKKRQIDWIAISTMGPYFLLFIIVMIKKEFKTKKSLIKKMGARGGTSALYLYAQSQKDIWPQIMPIVNIMKQMTEKQTDLDAEWYAMAEIPLGWMKRHDLLKVMKSTKRRSLLTVKERAEFTLDRKKSFLALRENLGPLWENVDELDFNSRCVLAVILPHVFGKVSVSRLLNRKIARYHESEKSKESLAQEEELRKSIEEDVNSILEKHKAAFIIPYFEESEFEDPFDPILASFEKLDSEEDMFDKGEEMVQATLLNHAYIKTVFLSLIEKSWTYGVLASAELIWVKKVDRGLWYILSQQGRTSAFVEVCGAWSHFLAEEAYGFKTLMPQVEEGLRALDYDLFCTHDNVVPHEQWEDSSKWDKLVPDSIGKGGNLPKGPGGVNSAKVI